MWPVLLAAILPTLPGLSDRLKADPSGRLARYVDYPKDAKRGRFVENPNWYLKGIDFSCVSPWNDASGVFRAGTAISRRHVIGSKHYPLLVGAVVSFVGVTGAVTRYKVVATRELPLCDIVVGLLDYELTPDVRPARILPDDFAKTLANGSRWPVVTFNQHEETLLSELVCSLGRQHCTPLLTNAHATDEVWRRYGGKIVAGDSGNPAFLLYGDQPVLLYCIQGTGAGVGPQIHRYRSRVQQAMDELCPGYRLEPFAFTP